MARDINWSRTLGQAFLANRGGVMDAVQRLRHRAWDYGYLRSTPQITVNNGPYIDIVPVDPAFYYVPYYDPAVVFFAPRPGFRVGLGIRFGPGITLGAAFAPWGWFGGGVRLRVGAHTRFPQQPGLGRRAAGICASLQLAALSAGRFSTGARNAGDPARRRRPRKRPALAQSADAPHTYT